MAPLSNLPGLIVVGLVFTCAILSTVISTARETRGQLGFELLATEAENDDNVTYYISSEPDEVTPLIYSGVSVATWGNSYTSKYMNRSVTVSQIRFEEASKSMPSSDGMYIIFREDCYLLAANGTIRLERPDEADFNCITTSTAGGCMVFVSSGTLLRLHALVPESRVVVLSSGDLSIAERNETRDVPQYFKEDIDCGPLYTQSGSCSGTAVSSTTTDCPGGLFDNYDSDISPPFPEHYHPRGAFYYVIEGRMTFGDHGKYRHYIASKHDMRFVKPHVYYGPEAAHGDESVVFLSLHEPDPAAYGAYVRAQDSKKEDADVGLLVACDFACEAEPGSDPVTCT